MSASAVSIRRAETSDYDPLTPVFDEAEALHRNALPAIFQRPAGHFPGRSYFDDRCTSADSAVFVAADGRELVGFLMMRIDQAPDLEIVRPHPGAVVDLLAVRSDRRHRGIGRSLMQAAHRWAEEVGAARLTLNVWEFNKPAITFYETLGYETLSRQLQHGSFGS
jgi:ribosomal protein S18 acetylase RimI-like enzyme